MTDAAHLYIRIFYFFLQGLLSDAENVFLSVPKTNNIE